MLLGLAAVIVGLFILCAGYLYFFQEKVVFVPSREIVMTPDEVGLVWEDVYLEVAPGVKINVWYISAPDSTRKTVLFCPGNAGNVSRRVFTAQFLTGLGVNVLLVDYRGYGRSQGSPSEKNAYADVQAAYNWLVNEKNLPPEEIYLFGRSLGGAIAIEVARRAPVAGLIVESSFTSAAEVGRRMFPFMPVKMLSRYRFDNAAKIGRLTCPVLITHSPKDDLIPFEMGQHLYELAPEPKAFIELSGAHNERLYYESDIYVNGLRKFLGLDQSGPR